MLHLRSNLSKKI